MFECMECGASIEPEYRLGIGDVIDCPECSAGLEVVDTAPLTVELSEGDDVDSKDEESDGKEEDQDWLS